MLNDIGLPLLADLEVDFAVQERVVVETEDGVVHFPDLGVQLALEGLQTFVAQVPDRVFHFEF